MAHRLARLALVLGATMLLLTASASALPLAGDVLLVDKPSAPLLDKVDDSSQSFAGGHTMSSDGRFVVFISDADALQPATHSLVFRRDRNTGETALASTGPSGPANGACGDGTISADGTRVAFSCS